METVEDVARVAVAVVSVVPYGDVLVRIYKLVSELRASKPMCEQLLKDLEDVRPRLEELIASDGVHYDGALKMYQELVATFQNALEDYVKVNFFARLPAHWKLKDRIQQFNNSLDNIGFLMDIDWQREDDRRHKELMSTLQRHEQSSLEGKQETIKELEELFDMLKTQPEEVAKLLRRETVSLEDLMDFKKMIKSNLAAYSKDQLKMMNDVLKQTSELLHLTIPHLSSWYVSRSDILYESGDPFSTSESNCRALYHGTIFSGTKVVVKTVSAVDNPTVIKKFDQEVKTWHELRHPHILPLYGANNGKEPLLLVMGRAESNFRDYLTTHRHRVWSVFLDAARGLAYLHKYKIVHGNLKCSNLLVNAQGVGMVSDFGFAFSRPDSAVSAKQQPEAFQWKAPECRAQDSAGRPESDVYAFGMCFFEAFTGSVPYSSVVDELEAIEMIDQGILPTADSDDMIPPEAWELIRVMCKREFSQRTSLNDVIRTLERYSGHEQLRNDLEQCSCKSPCCSWCQRPVNRSSIGPKLGLVNRSGTMKW